MKTRLIPAAVFLGGLLLYASTLAPSVVFGDPAEYTFVPYAWGVMHPPGYAFQTLLARLWQTLVPIGSIAYRTNLLSAAAAAAAAALTYASVLRVSQDSHWGISNLLSPIAALLAAALLATAPDFWQHAIHANAHIVTAALTALALFCLLRWRAETAPGRNRWLYAFALVAGLSLTHHPLLAFSFPAYAAFILAVLWTHRHRAPLRRRDAPQSPIPNYRFPNPLALAALFLLGLTPWLYFPIRASLQPPPVIGPSDMNSLEGFLNLALARGLRVNLFHFGLGQQWQRAIVLWSLLRLQWPAAVLALAPVGLGWLWRRDWRTGLLLSLFVGINLAFILNTVQDVMAYFLTPLVGLAMLAGLGGQAVVEWVDGFAGTGKKEGGKAAGGGWRSWIGVIALAGLLAAPAARAVYLYPRVSLRGYRAADEFVDGLFQRFAGRGERAVLLSDWEHLTPLWYRRHVEGRAFDPADLTPVFVSGGERPWVDAVWRNIEAGPIYVVEYQPQIVAEGFRLRPDGALFRVVAPPAVEPPRIGQPLTLVAGGQVEVLGYDLGATDARAGDIIPFTLYLRAPQPVSDILFPRATLGPFQLQWTTDSHLLTPAWQPGEIIAERFDLAVPLDAPAGVLPLTLAFENLSTGERLRLAPPAGSGSRMAVELATIRVTANPAAPGARVLDGLKANFGHRAGIERAEAWVDGRRHAAPWPEPLRARPGQAIHILIRWRALAPMEDSATVFVHLLDAGHGLWAGQDYTPLGGAFPTMLWFPKWLEGQTALDPYTLTVPPEAPAGSYYIEAGLYGLRTVRRLPAFDRQGNMAGDRMVLGEVVVGK
jgi:hypothetical protein